MSKAKQQAYQNANGNVQSGGGSFAMGFFLGQLTLAMILFFFIKFFIFGEAPSADERAATRAANRRQRTLSHSHKRTLSSALRPRPSSGVLKPRTEGLLTVQKILEKTYYNVHGHQPESLDWFNVLIAQTIAQLRADAQEDQAVLRSLTSVLNGSSRPDFLDEIRVTEISLGDEFPIFSNCRVIPVDENGMPLKELSGNKGERLQARMDVDLSDVVTLGIETKLVLNYPKPFVAVLPVALAVSVVRFSGTLSLSFSPSSPDAPQTSPPPQASSPTSPTSTTNEGHPLNPTGQSPTTLTFTFLDDYRLDLSVHSLIGSRARLQDVPKIAQLVEARIHQWFDERCVEPRFQQIVLPSLWPRKKNTRGAPNGDEPTDSAASDSARPSTAGAATNEHAIIDSTPADRPTSKKENARPSTATTNQANNSTPLKPAEITAEQRTRDWAAQHGKDKRKDDLSELELAGAEMREADERARRREQARTDHEREGAENVRLRTGRTAGN